MEFPEVATVVTHVGRNDDGTDPWTPSHVEAGITLRPYNTWPSGGTKHDLVRRMSARLAELPGYEIARQPADHRRRQGQGVRTPQPSSR